MKGGKYLFTSQESINHYLVKTLSNKKNKYIIDLPFAASVNNKKGKHSMTIS